MRITEVEVSGGDPGYITRGHVDKRDFLAAVMALEMEHGCIAEPSEFGFDLEDVRHIYQRDATKEDAEAKGYETFGFFCKLDDPGAYAITAVWP
jgi:hypothetical protein